MKIAGIETSSLQERETLDPGDKLTVGITHQIQIKGDNSWIKFEAVITVREGETSDQANKRAIAHVNDAVIDAVDQVVETVTNAYA